MDLLLALAEDYEYKHLLAELDGPDPDDLHHAAAAVVGQADTLITWNLADFPTDALAAHGIAVTKPDPYLCALSERYPDELRATITRMAAGKRRPPMTAFDLAAGLERAGVPAFAQRLRRLLATR